MTMETESLLGPCQVASHAAASSLTAESVITQQGPWFPQSNGKLNAAGTGDKIYFSEELVPSGGRLDRLCASYLSSKLINKPCVLSSRSDSNSTGPASDFAMIDAESVKPESSAENIPSSNCMPASAKSAENSGSIEKGASISLGGNPFGFAKSSLFDNNVQPTSTKRLIRAETSVMGHRKRALGRLKRRDGGQGLNSDKVDSADKEVLKQITKRLKRSQTASPSCRAGNSPDLIGDTLVSVRPCGDNVLVRVKIGL